MKNLITVLLLALVVGTTFAASSGKRQSTTITALSNDANGIFTDQTGTSITLDGALVSSGVATASAAQKVSLESTGDESSVNFTIVGTDADGKANSEVLAGPNANTVDSVLYYKTVTSITPSASITTAVEGGFLSASGAVSASLVPDLTLPPLMSIVVDSCTCTYIIEHTSMNTPSSVDQIWFSTVGLDSKTADAESNIVAPVGGVRARISAYTSGSLELIILQGRPAR